MADIELEFLSLTVSFYVALIVNCPSYVVTWQKLFAFKTLHIDPGHKAELFLKVNFLKKFHVLDCNRLEVEASIVFSSRDVKAIPMK